MLPDWISNIEAGLTTIQHNPNLFQKRYKKIRIHFIKRFPYGESLAFFIQAGILRGGKNGSAPNPVPLNDYLNSLLSPP